MAKLNKPHAKPAARSASQLPHKCRKKVQRRAPSAEPSTNKEWEKAVCPVCMEPPHNAVLLLCSSHDNGCGPYMCATSHHLSNCLEQYKRAYTRVAPGPHQPGPEGSKPAEESGSAGDPELPCPLCRGPVKGWTVVGPAREFLDRVERSCAHGGCSFSGAYKRMKRHVRSDHPLAGPREVDPTQAERWKRLEDEREVNDVLSTIGSAMPGSVVIGDYVIENGPGGLLGWARPALPPVVDLLSALDGGYFGVGDPFYLRGRRRGVSRVARLHARLLFGRQTGRLGW